MSRSCESLAPKIARICGLIFLISSHPTTATEVGTYTVRAGDDLQRISLQFFGTTRFWPKIAKINGIANPDAIFPDQVLNLDGVAAGRKASVTTPTDGQSPSVEPPPDKKSWQVLKSGEALVQAGKLNSAIAEFRNARTLDRANIPAWISEIRVLYQMKKLAQAKETVQMLLEKYPELGDLKFLQLVLAEPHSPETSSKERR